MKIKVFSLRYNCNASFFYFSSHTTFKSCALIKALKLLKILSQTFAATTLVNYRHLHPLKIERCGQLEKANNRVSR